jgi:hypothetical protein
MASILLALSLLSAASMQDSPGFHILPASALADLTDRPEPARIVRGSGRRCDSSEDPDEIVVCGDGGENYRLGELPDDPPPAPTFTGQRSYASAMEASRCANGCPPQGQIDVIRSARLIGRGLRRVFGGDD